MVCSSDDRLQELKLSDFDLPGHATSDGMPTEACRPKLSDSFVWVPLHAMWAAKLLSDRFLERDCLGDGNCQFRSIETALSNAGCKTNHKKLRQSVAKHVRKMPNQDFIRIVELYRLEKEHGEFQGNWDPFTINSKRDFIKVLSTPGFDFQGDDITLSLLSKAIGVDFVILNNMNREILRIFNPAAPNERIVILLYTAMPRGVGHYKCVGLRAKGDNVQTLFKRTKLPDEIEILLHREELLSRHVDLACLKTGQATLKHIMESFEGSVQTTVSREERKKVLRQIAKLTVL